MRRKTASNLEMSADSPPQLMRARTLSKLDQTVGPRAMPLTDKEMSKLSKVELRKYELALLDALVERAKLMGQADLVDRASRKRQTAVHRLATTVEDEKRASALAAAAAEAAALVSRAAAAAATVTVKAPGADAKSRKSRSTRESRESGDGSSAAGARHGAAATDGKGAAEVLLASVETSDAASNANAQPSTTTTSKPSNPVIIVPTALTPGPASVPGVTAGATAKKQSLSQSLATAKKAMARMEAARTKALKFIELAKKRERVQDKARIQNGTRMPYGMPYL